MSLSETPNVNSSSSKHQVSNQENQNHNPIKNHPMSNSPQSNPRFSLMQWFYNLPIRRKQILGLVASEVISIVGLVGVGSYLIIHGIREQAYHQVKAELAVTEVNYNIKINQMGFGFRGQSDNSAIIEAAQSYSNSRTIDFSLKEQVQQILSNEIRSRQIEYATLVGEDLKIIVNGNNNRTGEIFNPQNLVREVLNTPRQIKSSEIVTQQELLQESPPYINPKQIEHGLIRYTVTPVISPETKAVIAVLVSGDLINGKADTWNQTVEALKGGYTAIYSIPVREKPKLAFSILEQEAQNINSDNLINKQSNTLVFNQPLSNPELLFSALSNPNQVITKRLKINNSSYTVAAKTLRNFAGNPVAILVRGTPETLLNKLLKKTLSLQFIISIFALAIDVIIAIFLARTISKLIRNLKTASQEFSSGKLQARAEILSCDEIGELTVMFNQMAEKILKSFEKEQAILQAQSQLNTQLRQEINVRQQTEEQLKISLREKEVLLKEIHHRVKNNLFVVANLLEFQSDYFDEPKLVQALEDSKNRVFSMALIHEKLYKSVNLDRINFGEYLEQLIEHLLESYCGIYDRVKFVPEIDPIFLNIETAHPCGLIVNELVSNVFKHAFPDGMTGEVELKLSQNSEGLITLTVKDNGIGFPEDIDFQNVESLGMELICTLTTQLEGNLELIRGNGTTFNLTFSELEYRQRY